MRQHAGRIGDDGDAVFWRLDPAVRRIGPAGGHDVAGRAASRDFPRESFGFFGGLYFGGRDVAPVPVRSIDGFGLAPVYSAGPGEHRFLRGLAVGKGLTDESNARPKNR